MRCASVKINSGDSISVAIRWGAFGALTGAPTAVAYEVYDVATGTKIGGPEAVGSPSAAMQFVIHGDLLTTDTTIGTRHLRVQITGDFPTDRQTVTVDVTVEPLYGGEVVMPVAMPVSAAVNA